jgi:6-phosphogluconolactonase
VTYPACIREFSDPDALSREAAVLLLACSRQVLASRDIFSLALSGGSTPKKLYSLLAAPPWREAFSWNRIHFFWSDERCVPPENPESNYKLAYDGFLSHLPLPLQNIHRIRGEAGPEDAARSYEQELRNFFGKNELPRFDLVLLGAGEDGHTASLFPGAGNIQDQDRLVLPVLAGPRGLNRVTLSLVVLNNAARVLFLAAGSAKARVVREILTEENPQHYPAGMVRPVKGTLTWMIDREAGQQLREMPARET